MRPAILDKLFAPVTAVLPGIGSQIAKLFERLAGPLVLDLVWHLPSGIIDRRASPPIRALEPDRIATIAVRVEAHQPGFGRRPVSRAVHRQHRHIDPGLFQREGRPARAPVPDRRRARRQRPRRVLRQHAADGAPGPRIAARRARPPEADRAGLSADRGPVAARRAEGGGGGARPPPGIAGMDRPGVARAARLARLGRCGPPGACPGSRGRSVADDPGARAARL